LNREAGTIPLGALLALCAPLAVVACSFPDVTFSGDGGDADVAEAAVDSTVADEAAPAVDATGNDGGIASGDDTGTADDRAIVDGFGDARAIDDRGVVDEFVFEAAPDAPPCDQDLDMFLAEAGACGGNDCDDNDPRAHPGADFRTDPPHPPTNGDWNCDKRVDKQYPANLMCTALNLNALGGQPCSAFSGFVGDPGCGQSDTFVTCVPGSLLLGNVTCMAPPDAGTRMQGCR
jgi:hypothetical protein